MAVIDLFRLGVHVKMSTNSAQILSTMLAQLTGVHLAAGKVATGLAAIRQAAIGAGLVFAGWAVIKGLYDATKHAEKLNHELVKLQTGARLTDKQTGLAETLAFKTSRDVRGTNVAENVKMQRELFGVFGDMDTAQSLLPLVAQGSRVVANFVDKDTDLAQIAVRALELRGHITKDHKVDPKEFAEEFNSMVRSIIAEEGLIDPAKLWLFIRQAGPAARTMNSDEFWGKAPTIMNALGAQPAGTALMSLFQQMVGHVIAGKRVAVAMEQAGMLTPGKWKVERGGKVRMDQDAVPKQAEFMDRPFTWIHDRLQEMRAKTGPDGKPVDETQIIQDIFQLASRATSARLISDIDANWPIIEAGERRYHRIPDIAGIAKEQNEKDVKVNIHNLSEAWDNFMAALGKPGTPILIGVLTKMTDALNYLQATVLAHPTAAEGLFHLAGGIAAFTMLGGSLVLLNLAWSPFVTGIKLLIGVMAPAEVAAATAGATGLAAGIGTLMTALSRLSGIGTFLYGMAPSPTNKGEAEFLEKQRRMTPGEFQRDHDGASPLEQWYKEHPDVQRPDGMQSQQQNGAPLGSAGNPIHTVVRNGKDIAHGVSNYQADQASRPMSGGNAPDPRLSPLMPGLGAAWAVP